MEFLCKLCGSEEKRKAWQDQVEQYLQESMTKVCGPPPIQDFGPFPTVSDSSSMLYNYDGSLVQLLGSGILQAIFVQTCEWQCYTENYVPEISDSVLCQKLEMLSQQLLDECWCL